MSFGFKWDSPSSATDIDTKIEGHSDEISEAKKLPKEVGISPETSHLPKEIGYTDGDNAEKAGDLKEVLDYYSTYEERIQQTPREVSDRGEWTGVRGESKYIPSDAEVKAILDKYNLDGIEYKDGIPDFSECSEATVEIDDMSDQRHKNFEQCDQKCADQWNEEKRDGRSDWTPRDVAEWRAKNGYSWHERNDMKTCDLVPTKINDYFGHLGGVSECRKRDAQSDEGDEFDE